ncbi:MAG: CRISPR-associated helicase Cas3', partial [Candidatus Micrarchaeota archaeon]|nr:CRISPR-associated helicase Cas3' [Candidatus Micrarchaeota archaeon]
MIEEIYARKNQPLINHLNDNIVIPSKLNDKDKTIVKLVYSLHDIGKASVKFQNKLLGKSDIRYRHTIAALPIVDYILNKHMSQLKFTSTDCDLCILSIYYHHTYISLDMLQDDLLKTKVIIQKEKSKNHSKDIEPICVELEDLNHVEEIIKNLKFNENNSIRLNFDKSDFISNYLSLKDKDNEEFQYRYVEKLYQILLRIYKGFSSVSPTLKRRFVRIYSALAESDWSSTKEEIPRSYSWKKLLGILNRKLDEKASKDGVQIEQKINEIRKEIEGRLLSSSNIQNNKIFLCAPTGVGKTELSFKWALERAEYTHAERIIYVLPFRNLINDLYNRFKYYFGEDLVDKWDTNWITDETLERLKEFRSLEDFNFYKVSRKYFMEKPIILTTADQLLNSFFNLERYPIRSGLLRNSVIVFDEIQGYGLDMRNHIYNMIKDILEDDSNSSIMVMTATPPPEIEESKDSYLILEENFVKVFDKRWWDFHKMRDSIIKIEESDNLKNLLSLFDKKLSSGSFNKVCIIFNTIGDAVTACSEIKKKAKNKKSSLFGYRDNILLVHSSLIEKDKEEACKILKSSDKVIAISTQVLEAGVDVSFDLMIRISAPLPSLIQALGRVNRDGRSVNSEFIIIVPKKEEDKENNNKSNEKEEDKGEDKEKSEKEKKGYKFSFEKPYDPLEIKRVIYLLREMFKNNNNEKIKKSEFSEKLLEKIKDFLPESIRDESRFYSEYVSTISQNTVWSVSDVTTILGSNLRDSFNKVEVYVKDETFDQRNEELGNLFSELKENYDPDKMKKFIDTLKEIRGRLISISPWDEKNIYESRKGNFITKFITEEFYNSKYKGQEDS